MKQNENLYVCMYHGPVWIHEITFRNEVDNLFDNMHARINIYREFYHNIIYIVNEGLYDFMLKYMIKLIGDLFAVGTCRWFSCGGTRTLDSSTNENNCHEWHDI